MNDLLKPLSGLTLLLQGSSWLVHLVQERLCLPELWQGRQMCHSTMHQGPSLMRCLWVLEQVESGIYLVSMKCPPCPPQPKFYFFSINAHNRNSTRDNPSFFLQNRHFSAKSSCCILIIHINILISNISSIISGQFSRVGGSSLPHFLEIAFLVAASNILMRCLSSP